MSPTGWFLNNTIPLHSFLSSPELFPSPHPPFPRLACVPNRQFTPYYLLRPGVCSFRRWTLTLFDRPLCFFPLSLSRASHVLRASYPRGLYHTRIHKPQKHTRKTSFRFLTCRTTFGLSVRQALHLRPAAPRAQSHSITGLHQQRTRALPPGTRHLSSALLTHSSQQHCNNEHHHSQCLLSVSCPAASRGHANSLLLPLAVQPVALIYPHHLPAHALSQKRPHF